MPLTVLQVAYPLAAVGPNAVGGAEQVLSFLDRRLVQAGHRSIVVGHTDSECAGTLIPVPAIRGPLEDHRHPVAQAWCRNAIAEALRRWPVDVIHFHGIDFDAYLPPDGPPTLVTLHLPPGWYAPGALTPRRPATHFHCVSTAQRRQCPPGVKLLEDVENAVPIDELTARHGKRPFVLSLGRICPEKGFHVALDAAAEAGVPLLLGGHVFPYAEHAQYFEQQIAPRLGPTARFLGPLEFARKRRLLTAARALLAPSMVAETSSLVAMEAMACGTPVIAFRSGALADLIEDGVTGFLVEDVRQMAAAIRRADSLDPQVCRDVARARFAPERMWRQYAALYASVAAGTAMPQSHRHAGSDEAYAA